MIYLFLLMRLLYIKTHRAEGAEENVNEHGSQCGYRLLKNGSLAKARATELVPLNLLRYFYYFTAT